MKTVRTICFVAAGFYGMQALSFFLVSGFLNSFSHFGNARDIVAMQRQFLEVQLVYSPYLLIGVLVFLLLAWQYVKMWKLIPWITGLVMALAAFWMWRLSSETIDNEKDVYRDFLPESADHIMSIMIRINSVIQIMMLLLPALLIIIFWFRARNKKEKEAAALAKAEMRY